MKGKPSSRQKLLLVSTPDSRHRPNTFWVSLAKLDLKPGASVEKLTIQNGEVFSGDVIDQFKDAEPFKLSICRGASGDVYVNYRRIGSRTPATTPLASITRRAQSTKAFRIVVSAPSSSAIA